MRVMERLFGFEEKQGTHETVRLESETTPDSASAGWSPSRFPQTQIGRSPNYERAASLKALAARRRTTVLALILMASPVCGLRPMRALPCAFTARPILGMTHFPAGPLHSLTATFKSSPTNIPP